MIINSQYIQNDQRKLMTIFILLLLVAREVVFLFHRLSSKIEKAFIKASSLFKGLHYSYEVGR